MAKITAKARRGAFLFTSGPEGVRGNWNAAMLAAGYKVVPPVDHKILRELIEAEGVAPPDQENPQSIDLTLPDADDEAGWVALGGEVLPLWKAIARGDIKANPSQKAVLQDIINRAYGKVGSQRDDVKDPGVVVLPIQGADASIKVIRLCPRCNYDLTDGLGGK